MGSKDTIFKTLLYSDIFDYPLNKNEIFKFLALRKIDKNNLDKYLKESVKEGKLILTDGFYCFPERQKIIAIRLEREKESLRKISRAKKITKLLNYLPSVKLIGISGSLALKNCKKDDDIDLFVITGKNSLWLTRLIIIAFLKLGSNYRNYNSKNVSDKFCLNMLVTEGTMVLPKTKRNFYTSHEVVQLMPLFNRDETYEKFLGANIWVKKFLPNSLNGIAPKVNENNKNIKVSIFLVSLESLARRLQLFLMKKHKTTEIISDDFVAFHPFDYEGWILLSYERRLKKYGFI